MQSKEPQIAKMILKKNKVENFTCPEFKAYYKAIVVKTVWHCHKDKYMKQ